MALGGSASVSSPLTSYFNALGSFSSLKPRWRSPITSLSNPDTRTSPNLHSAPRDRRGLPFSVGPSITRNQPAPSLGRHLVTRFCYFVAAGVPSLRFHTRLSVGSPLVVSQCYVLLRDTTTTMRVYRITVPRHEVSAPSAALHRSHVALGPNRHTTSDALRRPHLPTPPYEERITTPIPNRTYTTQWSR